MDDEDFDNYRDDDVVKSFGLGSSFIVFVLPCCQIYLHTHILYSFKGLPSLPWCRTSLTTRYVTIFLTRQSTEE